MTLTGLIKAIASLSKLCLDCVSEGGNIKALLDLSQCSLVNVSLQCGGVVLKDVTLVFTEKMHINNKIIKQ